MTKQELIKAAKLAYYNTDTPIMTDEQYDRLVKETGEEEVGAPVLEELKKIKITDKPMLSLAKCHTSVELNNFAQGQDLIASIKCDGLSVRLIYENGILIQGNTRGDGETGQDITEHLKYFVNVPYIINDKHRVVIDGEAIIFQKDFNKININGEFKNPRNLAAGTLASLDPTLCQSRHLSFLAWDLIEGSDLDSYHERMNYICHNLDIDIVPWFCFGGEYTYDSLNQEILDIAKEKGIPCDGVVWKYDNINYNTERTAHHFCNAIAWKPAMTEYETSLIDIEYETSRYGYLTPVAKFKPINTGDSIIEKASLHNLSIMEELLGKNPKKGQKVYVIKANDVIPQIVRSEIDNDLVEEITIPKVCPICGSPTEITISENTTKKLSCTNTNCISKITNYIDHYASKKGMDIKGLSATTINKLNDWGWLNSIKDIYELKNYKNEWINKAGFGEKSVNNILNSIEQSKNCTLSQFISALSIPLVGVNIAKEIEKKFTTWANFRKAVEDDSFSFYSLDGFGYEMNKKIKEFKYAEADYIAEYYLEFKQNEVKVENDNRISASFAITGKLNHFKNRDELKAYIESIGGKVTSTVSSKTNYLINNDNNSNSSKNKTAKSLNIPIITEEEFLEKFGQK